MSSNYRRNEALVFAAATSTQPSTKSAPSTMCHGATCQLEYLDLSAESNRRTSNVMSVPEAEFYSFDDYLPNNPINLDYENVYNENNNRTPADKCLPARSTRLSSNYHNEPLQLPTADLSWQREAAQQEALSGTYSTCSGSSISSQSSYPSSISREQFARSNLARSLEKAAAINGRFSFSQSLSSSMTHSIYDNMNPVMSKSLSTDSFRRLAAAHQVETERPKSNMFMPTSIPEYAKTKSDNQLSSNRTEELLNGIVKLAVNDELIQSSKSAPHTPPSKPHQTKQKETLKTSQSTPLLSAAQSQNLTSSKSAIPKPSSPSASTSKKFTFSRKGSFNSHQSSETEKKLDKKNKSGDKAAGSSQLNAFQHAVEHFDIDKVSVLISSDSSCVNSVNSDGLTALDIAVLTNHVPMIKTLTKHGAQTRFLDEHRDNNLCTVLQEFINGAQQKVVQIKSSSNSSHKDNEKKISQLEFRHRLFRRMRSGYEQAGLPSQPQNTKLSVTSDSSLHVKFDAPEGSNGAIVTRYKVEWSKAQNFRPLAGEYIINDIHNLNHEITGLDSGVAYYVRVTAWNIKGFGRCSYTDPFYAIPSSWRDVEQLVSRTNSYRLHKVHSIIDGSCSSRSRDRSLARTASTNSQHSPESPPYNRKASAPPIIRGLRGLFSSSFKFQKSLKRGVYLAAICYSDDDKILMTTEDNLPIVEVDESYSGSSIQVEFDWLMKVVATSWDTARQLKQDLEKLSELSSAHLKYQLLTAVLQLQEMMGLQELGKLFYKPIHDGNGSIVLAIVNQLTDPKQLGNISGSLKWQSHSKLIKNSQPADPLLPLLNEMIFFHQVSLNKLPTGLYLGYLHIKIANVESIKVLAPENNPSVLPFMKIRDCSNVSKAEWKSLLDLGLPGKTSNKPEVDSTEIITFKKQLMKSARKLASKLGVAADLLEEHRFYDVEVLDFSKQVSFILLMPPRDLVCTSFKSQPSQSDTVGVLEPSSEYMEIPVKAFEMLHLHAYQSDFTSTYSKAATVVDTQLALAQMAQREAFSNEEIETSRGRLESCRLQQQQLEEIWRSTRWLMDAITYARDKATQGVSVTGLYNSIVEQLSCSISADSIGKSSDDGYHSDKISLGGSSGSGAQQTGLTHNNTNNNNVQYYDGESDQHHHHHLEVEPSNEILEPGILRVYAAYKCGLARGTSVMLHVTALTTAREVINLVVMQLNQAVARKYASSPTYTESQLFDFCLVAVIGPRERVLRDDYRVLQLQNPWTKGKLYVRLKNNLLAALEHGETTDV